MKIVPAKCPNCGGVLEVDSEKDAAICQFCQSPFIVEKAIQNFNITYNYTTVNNTVNNTVTNISGQEVHIHQDGESPERLFENIKSLLERKEYRLAEKTRGKLKEKYPADYRVDETEVLFLLNGYSASHHKWLTESVSCYDDLVKDSLETVATHYFLYALDRLKKSNGEAYKNYYNGLLNATNKKLSKDLKRELTGQALVCKLTGGEWRDISKEFFALDNMFNCYDNYTHFNDVRESIDVMNKMLMRRANDMRKNRYTLCVNELGDYAASGVAIGDDGADDDYLICIISKARNDLKKLNNWSPKGEQCEIGDRLKKSKQCLTEFIDVATSRLSDEGKQKCASEQKARRRNELKTFWEGYAKYLNAGMYRDAYNLLNAHGTIMDVTEELAKFKKGLFNVKYNGNAADFNLNGAIEKSLGAENL